MSRIKKGDVVDFNMSPEYSVNGTVKEVREMSTGEDGYNQYIIEEDDGTTWTLHRDDIKGIHGPAKPSFDCYDRAMRGF